MSANLATANTVLVNAPIISRLVNVDQRQGQLNALGTAKPHTQHVKNVVFLIVMKLIVLMALTHARMVAVAPVNVVHLLRHLALRQAVALVQAVAQAHLRVGLLQALQLTILR